MQGSQLVSPFAVKPWTRTTGCGCKFDGLQFQALKTGVVTLGQGNGGSFNSVKRNRAAWTSRIDGNAIRAAAKAVKVKVLKKSMFEGGAGVGDLKRADESGEVKVKDLSIMSKEGLRCFGQGRVRR